MIITSINSRNTQELDMLTREINIISRRNLDGLMRSDVVRLYNIDREIVLKDKRKQLLNKIRCRYFSSIYYDVKVKK